MNAMLSMLTTKKLETTASPGKAVNSNSKPNAAKKTSFSDSLNNAVSRSNAKMPQDSNQNPVEQLNSGIASPANTPIVLGAPVVLSNLIQQDLDSATGQTNPDLLDLFGTEAIETGSETVETDQLSQDMLSAINSGVLVAQMMVPVQTTNSESAIVAEPTNVSVISEQDLPVTVTTTNHVGIADSLINQSSELVTNVAQPIQEQTAAVKADPAKNLDQTKTSSVLVTTNSSPQVPTNAVLMNQSKGVTDSADKPLAAKAGEPIQQAVDPNLVVAVNQQEKSLKQQFHGEDQKESPADKNLFAQPQTAQDHSVDFVDVFKPNLVAQGVESLLAVKSDTLAAPASIEAQHPANSSTDIHQVVDQIVEQTKVITKQQNTEMIIKLKPEHLGEITLKVVVENGSVKASFHSNNSDVRGIIEASLPQLKQDLSNNGLKVEDVSVYAGLSQFSPNQDHDRSSRQQLMKLNNKKSSGDFIEAIESEQELGRVPGIGTQSGVDYRI